MIKSVQPGFLRVGVFLVNIAHCRDSKRIFQKQHPQAFIIRRGIPAYPHQRLHVKSAVFDQLMVTTAFSGTSQEEEKETRLFWFSIVGGHLGVQADATTLTDLLTN